ncbi:MAG: PaaI family thioesterase [Henriciella sp.]|nr:PaaI family thioesterase [Henriciella sp.]MBO6695362.1 PaaI family thioesterase [Henriciella sp.]
MTWGTEMLENMKRGTHPVPPVTRTLQLGLIDDWGDGWVRKTWTPKEELLQQDGTMFGGYIASLFDQIFAFAAMTVIHDDEAYRTSNLNISFLSLSRRESVTLEANVVSRSRRLITIEGKMIGPDGTVRSIATAQQITTRRDPAP